MAKELTRVGVKGLELTREEVIGLQTQVEATLRKAQCREVNCDIVDMFDEVGKKLSEIYRELTIILEENE